MSKRFRIPFDKRGGVVVLSLRMIKSESYLSLSPQAKVLITLMQSNWRNEKHVDYGIREATQKIPCAKGTAMKAFKQLEDRGFITLKDESLFSSRTECKSRTWQLEWMPFNDRKPTNKWEEMANEN